MPIEPSESNFVNEQDNIVPVPGGFVRLRDEDLTAAIIEGLYGRGTEIYPVDNDGIIASKNKSDCRRRRADYCRRADS